MIKAVVVKNNIVQKIVVAKNLGSVRLYENEVVHEYPKGRDVRFGDTFEGVFTRMLKYMGIK